nr:reverse transcriptase domain-containing protein [Tanacetum cinerariifolium]
MTANHNDWDTSIQRSESSSSITSSSDSKIVALKAEMPPLAKLRTYMLREPIIKVVILTDLKGNNQGRNQFFQGASHGQNPPPAYQALSYQGPGYQAPVHQGPIPQPQVMNTALSSGLRTLPSNTINNPKEDLKGITTRSGNAYKGPTIPTTSSPPKLVERDTEVTKDTVPPTNNESTKDVQPPVVQIETPIPNSEPVVAHVCAPKPNQKPSIPYPSRLHDQKLRNKANDQKEKFFQIFKRRSLLKTGRALIDVYEGELTLR